MSARGSHIHRSKAKGKSFEQLIDTIETGGSLTHELILAVKRIRMHGNHAAHLAEKVDELTFRRMTVAMRQAGKGQKTAGRPYWLIPPPKQAVGDLRWASVILLRLAEKKAAEAAPFNQAA